MGVALDKSLSGASHTVLLAVRPALAVERAEWVEAIPSPVSASGSLAASHLVIQNEVQSPDESH
jgi:hypothetical protein